MASLATVPWKRIRLTGDRSPVKQRPQKFSHWALEKINAQVQDMLKMGVIWDFESNYASNCIVIIKKVKTARVSIDNGGLDTVTQKDCYRICDTQTLLDCLNGESMFTSLDLYSGYYQADVALEDEPTQDFSFRVVDFTVFKGCHLFCATRR